MANVVIMPKQGQSVESCIITKWHKKVGDPVSVGDLLFSYETDKAAFDEESAFAGVVLAILAEEGDDVPCLDNVCIIGEAGEDISALVTQQTATEEPAAAEQSAKPQPVAEPLVTATTKEDDDRAFVSPRARMAAQRQGVDAAFATPTGPGGRIIERDIYALSEKGEAAPKAAPQPELAVPSVPDAPYTDEKLSGVRKAIAKAMHNSLSSMAQLSHQSSFDASRLLAFRKQVKNASAQLGVEDITINDMILFAVSRVLKNHPDLNAHYLEDKMRLFHTVNIGIAVDTDRGLLVPTLFGADKLSLSEISKHSKQRIAAARSGKISPELLSGGTFTVTNLGSLGVEGFTPVINPPQTAILGVFAIISRVVVTQAGLAAYTAMGLSLTYDHRAVDGAPAARFAQELGKALENFDLLLAK